MITQKGNSLLHSWIVSAYVVYVVYSSLVDEELPRELPPLKEVVYTIIEESSQRGKPKLVDSLGYSYSVNKLRHAFGIFPGHFLHMRAVYFYTTNSSLELYKYICK